DGRHARGVEREGRGGGGGAAAETGQARGVEGVSAQLTLLPLWEKVGAGGARMRGVGAALKSHSGRAAPTRTPWRSHPSSVRLRLPPYPTRGEGFRGPATAPGS